LAASHEHQTSEKRDGRHNRRERPEGHQRVVWGRKRTLRWNITSRFIRRFIRGGTLRLETLPGLEFPIIRGLPPAVLRTYHDERQERHHRKH
jgi:hypothetical protein